MLLAITHIHTKDNYVRGLRCELSPLQHKHVWNHHIVYMLLLLLLSLFSRVRLCNPIDGSHQAPPSLGFSRQEDWSGLPFPSPMHESEKWKWSRSGVSDSLQPHGLQPTRLLRPWDFPGKSTGPGCHCLLRLYTYIMLYANASIKLGKNECLWWLALWGMISDFYSSISFSKFYIINMDYSHQEKIHLP